MLIICHVFLQNFCGAPWMSAKNNENRLTNLRNQQPAVEIVLNVKKTYSVFFTECLKCGVIRWQYSRQAVTRTWTVN